MFFIKNEVVQLDNQKKYLVIDATILNNEAFYQIQEINKGGTNVVGDKSIIKAINKNGSLFVESLMDEEKLLKLKEIFTS